VNIQTKHNSEEANNAKHSKTKLLKLSRLYDNQPGNEMGLFYNAPELLHLK